MHCYILIVHFIRNLTRVTDKLIIIACDWNIKLLGGNVWDLDLTLVIMFLKAELYVLHIYVLKIRMYPRPRSRQQSRQQPGVFKERHGAG